METAQVVEPSTKRRACSGVVAEHPYHQAGEFLGEALTGNEGLELRIRHGIRHHINHGGQTGVVTSERQRAGGECLDGDKPNCLWEQGRSQGDVRSRKKAAKLG